MSYYLTKARLNTHFNAIQNHFKTTDLIDSWLAKSKIDYALITKSAFADQYQITASSAYIIKTNQAEYNLAVKVTQSTQLTVYCFDVFLMFAPENQSDEFTALAQSLNNGLNALRKKYNGNWVISDDELTLSVLQ